MRKDYYTKFPFTIGQLPTSYLMSLSYEEQLTWLCNYIKTDIIEALKNIELTLSEWENIVKELQEKLDLIDNLISEFNELKLEFNQLKIDVEQEIDDEINRLSREIDSKINTEFNKLYIYLSEVEDRIDNKINNISLDNFKMVNPLTGNMDSVNNLIYILFDQLRSDPITASEFDNLQLTATGFDSKEITAYDFDNNGKSILI